MSKHGFSNFKIGLLDGLHRSFAMVSYISSEDKLTQVFNHPFQISLKVFNMKPLCSEIFENKDVVYDFQTLCSKLSYVITEEGSKTIGFTYNDALIDCFEYIKVNASSVNIPDMKTTVTSSSKKTAGQKTDVNVLSLVFRILKPLMTSEFGDHIKNLYRILCRSSEYYDLVQQTKITNQVSKEDFIDSLDDGKTKVCPIKNCIDFFNVIFISSHKFDLGVRFILVLLYCQV